MRGSISFVSSKRFRAEGIGGLILDVTMCHMEHGMDAGVGNGYANGIVV